MSQHDAQATPPEPVGTDPVGALVARCAARALSSGGAAVVDALAARAGDLAHACEASDDAAEVLAAGLGLVMLECAGRASDQSAIGPAVARVAEGASPALVMRLSVLAAAAGAFDVARALASTDGPLDDPFAELAWCVTDGPLDGLQVPWRALVEARATPIDLVLVAVAGQRRVHLLTVDRARTLDALAADVTPPA
ncbi:MAG: hypothetical protein IT374_28280 [Polyangiaceae bacterium]|nr:hypothetical protein [Polyangiaceae bacterium]